MKVSVAALSILMVMAFSALTFSAPMGTNPPTSCCFFYARQQIPRIFVTGYYRTSGLCSKPGVVFNTTIGKESCANPSDDWVKEYMADPKLN